MLGQKLKEIAREDPKLVEWFEKHGKEFQDALGMWTSDQDMLLMLSKMRHTCGEWTRPDETDWAWKDVVKPFIYNDQDVKDISELRSAVRLLVARYNTACQHIDNLERAKRVPMSKRFFPRPGGIL